jgi:hypothetical protein
MTLVNVDEFLVKDECRPKADIWFSYQMAQSRQEETVTPAELLNIQIGEISYI